MAEYITDIYVSVNALEEQQLQSQGFLIIDENLNEGTGGNRVFLWYKQGSISAPITRIQASFNEEMEVGLGKAGYHKIKRNLNSGAGCECKAIYLWYFKGSGRYHTPIEEISVTTNSVNEARKFKNGWERLACDLNRKVGGDWIHIWMSRSEQTYICDVDATDSFGVDKDNFKDGYIRMDEDTNRGPNGSFVFLWYRQTTNPERALTDLKISTDNTERMSCQQQGYTSLGANLNDQSGAGQVYMWYKKSRGDNPIEGMTLIVNDKTLTDYEKHGANVIKKNLNEGNCNSMFLAFRK